MATRTINGRMSLTIVRASDQDVVHNKRHAFRNEPEERTRAINRMLGQAIMDISNADLFGDEFNPGADATQTFEAHYHARGVYSDGQPAFRADVEWDDLDTVDVKALLDLFEQLK